MTGVEHAAVWALVAGLAVALKLMMQLPDGDYLGNDDEEDDNP